MTRQELAETIEDLSAKGHSDCSIYNQLAPHFQGFIRAGTPEDQRFFHVRGLIQKARKGVLLTGLENQPRLIAGTTQSFTEAVQVVKRLNPKRTYGLILQDFISAENISRLIRVKMLGYRNDPNAGPFLYPEYTVLNANAD